MLCPIFFCLLMTGRVILALNNKTTTDRVLEHVVIYEPLPVSPEYRSNDSFNPRGMEHVYLLTNMFLDLIQRDKVLPASINTSDIVEVVQAGPTESLQFLTEHWEDLLLQYIGLLTAAVVGLLLALLLPLVGCFFCCCRCCCARCGAHPDTHYDKRGDGCRRTLLGLLLALFVIAAMFGIVCAFVTNHYTFKGWSQVSGKLSDSIDDAGDYFDHTGKSIKVLLVNNFEELEEVVNNVMDDSGPILKKKLGTITEAIAIDNLNSIVAGLGSVKRNLKDILSDTQDLDRKVLSLQDGLRKSQQTLGLALAGCSASRACNNFLKDYDLERDLALAEKFVSIQFKVPEITNVLTDISDLIENDIDKKVEVGKAKFDQVERQIEASIEDIKPRVKTELREMGEQLASRNSEIQSALKELNFRAMKKDVPQIDQHSQQVVEWRYYVGLGMSSTVLLILVCFILGLFYGMCGRRPGGLYGEECCNRGTGANFLATGIYLTFLFSFLLMILTTFHFLLGAAVEKAVCETLESPLTSDIFQQVDREILKPKLEYLLEQGTRSDRSSPTLSMNASQLIVDCHNNKTLYDILHVDQIYNISELSNWRETHGIGGYIENLKGKFRLESELSNLVLLTPATRRDLEELAKSSISDMNFTKFTDIIETEITKIDLKNFVRRLYTLKEQVERFPAVRQVAIQLVNEALWLENLDIVVGEMKVTLRHLKESIAQLEKNSRFNKSSMREAILGLISQTDRATRVIRREGPALVDQLSQQFATETAGLVDEYVDRVVDSVRGEVGYCAPLSTSYNATVVAVCLEVVQPFNGFWASVGWCFLLYLPCIFLSVSLISLYRKTESYPGPLIQAEVQPLDEGLGRDKKRRGHRRQPSSLLPEVSHGRRALPATPSDPPQEYSHARYRDRERQQQGSNRHRDSREGPPRYTSNPSLGPRTGEYERPPPYYYPGQGPPDVTK